MATRRVDFPLRGGLSRRKYAACRRVVAVSSAIREVLLKGGLAPGRLRLVYEGVPDRPPQPGGREALRELGVPEGALVVGNVAALTDHKDQRTLLRAAAEVLRAGAQACFVVVGEGELRAPSSSWRASWAWGRAACSPASGPTSTGCCRPSTSSA